MFGIKKPIAESLLALICLLALASCQSSPKFERIDDHKEDIYFWPKTYSDDDDRILTLYQPQITEWKKFGHLSARAAIAYKTPLDVNPTFGTLVLNFKTSVNLKERQVKATEMKVKSLKFSGLDKERVAEIKEAVGELFPSDGMLLSLDRLVANFKRKLSVKPVRVKSDPPPIFFSKDPAILIIFNGKPIWSPIKGNKLQFTMNTNWDLFWDKSANTYYLRNFDGWMSAPALKGPWKAGAVLPKAFNQLPDDDNWKEVKANIPGRKLSPEAAPNVFVSYKPGELILLDGEPNLRIVGNTSLMWVANTESDLFFSMDDKFFYYLVSGRWFRSRELSNNSRWEFASHRLPQDFKNIPDNSPRARVRVSVPGTPEAESAMIMAQIPQKATVEKGKLKPEVTYVGDPQFQPIPETGLSYAVNTSSDVILYKNIFYLCQNGVWFVSSNPSGPWKLATEVPSEMYKIPPSSPKHNTTYVYIYDTGPNSVTYGYTSGYSNVYVSYGVVVYGSGWYYPPYYYYDPFYHPYPYYYHYPYSYGGSSFYNPHTGTYGHAGWAYGPYGGVGYGTAYNPTTGTYARAGAAYGPYHANRWVEAYNPHTNTSLRSGQGTNYYSSWGATAIRRDDQWVATAHYKNDQGSIRKFADSEGNRGFIGYNEDNLYAGKDGNVYRRDEDGWHKYEDGNWNPVEGRTPKDGSNQHSDQIKQRRSEGGASIDPHQPKLYTDKFDKPRSGDASIDRTQVKNDRSNLSRKSNGSVSQQLDQDHRARQRGQDQLNKTPPRENRERVNRSSMNRSRGQWGSRMGRGRR